MRLPELSTLKTGDKLFGAPGYDVSNIIEDDTGTRMLGVRYDGLREETKLAYAHPHGTWLEWLG